MDLNFGEHKELCGENILSKLSCIREHCRSSYVWLENNVECGNVKYANTFDNKRADFYRGHFMKEMNRMLKFLSNIPYLTDSLAANFSDFHNMEFE